MGEGEKDGPVEGKSWVVKLQLAVFFLDKDL